MVGRLADRSQLGASKEMTLVASNPHWVLSEIPDVLGQAQILHG